MERPEMLAGSGVALALEQEQGGFGTASFRPQNPGIRCFPGAGVGSHSHQRWPWERKTCWRGCGAVTSPVPARGTEGGTGAGDGSRT